MCLFASIKNPGMPSLPAIGETNFSFRGQTAFYRGKVRDVYYFGNVMAVVATDRISAFDVVLPRAIPDKGRVLNQLAAINLEATRALVPNWVISTPDPNVTIGRQCEPVKVEMVVRGYLAGHAARQYKAGKRTLCGVALPEGLKENDRLPTPIITPTTKASVGHDEDISRDEILSRGLITPSVYEQMEAYALTLFGKGTALAAARGLILVDTKYEFGLHQGDLYLIDEVHTPDSSRYFYADGYADRQARGEGQKQLSKEFVRQWLIENGFQGQAGQRVPEMTDEMVEHIRTRYTELYEIIAAKKLEPVDYSVLHERIEASIVKSL